MSIPKDPKKLELWLSKQKPKIQKRWLDPERREKLWKSCSRPQPKGENNPRWKGNEIKYNSAHLLVAKIKQKPDSCQICGMVKERLELANLSGVYNRNPDNYIWLCTKCHRRMDRFAYKKMKASTRHELFFNQYYQEQSALLGILI